MEMLSLKEVVFGDLEREIASTRRVLARVPDEHFAWKPHDKSMSLGALSTHLANLLFWQATILERDELDLETLAEARRKVAADRAALLRFFDDLHERVTQAVAATEEAALARPWTLRRGAHVILELPRAAVLRSMGISHMVHHRGQLSVYLRLLDVPVPGVYGPSADEGAPLNS